MLNDLDEDRKVVAVRALTRASGFDVTPEMVTMTSPASNQYTFTPTASGTDLLGKDPATLSYTRVAFADIVKAWGMPRMPMVNYDTATTFAQRFLSENGILLDSAELSGIAFPLDLTGGSIGNVYRYPIPTTSDVYTGEITFSVYGAPADVLRYTLYADRFVSANEGIKLGICVDPERPAPGGVSVTIGGQSARVELVENVIYARLSERLDPGYHEIRIDSTRAVYTCGHEAYYCSFRIATVTEITRQAWSETGDYWIGMPVDSTDPISILADCYQSNANPPVLKQPLKGGGITHLYARTFRGCIIPDGVEFLYGTGLTSLPDSLFSGATVSGKWDRAFPPTVETVGYSVFPDGAPITSMVSILENSPLRELRYDFVSPCGATLTDLTSAFAGTLLETLPGSFFAGCTALTTVRSTFENCVQLRTIPAHFFVSCTALEDASRVFYGAARLTNPGLALFQGLSTLRTLDEAFYAAGSALTDHEYGVFGQDMLGGCTGLVSARYAFAGCPFRFMGVDAFDDCTALKDISYIFARVEGGGVCLMESLSDSVFLHCTALTDIQYFMYGSHLKTIPANLLKNMPKVSEMTDISGAFAQTRISSIPTGLLDACTSLEKVSHLFEGCSVGSIPDNLFTVCGKTLKDMSYCFLSARISSMPSNMLSAATVLETTEGMFKDSTLSDIGSRQNIPSTVLTNMASMFENTSITSYPDSPLSAAPSVNYARIFAGSRMYRATRRWFSNQTQITSLEEAFARSRLYWLSEGLIPSTCTVSNLRGLCRDITTPYTMEVGWFTPTNGEIDMTEAFSGMVMGGPIRTGALTLTSNTTCDRLFYDASTTSGIKLDVSYFERGIDAPGGTPKSYHRMLGGSTSTSEYNVNLQGNGSALLAKLNLTSADGEEVFGRNPNITY